MDKGDYLMIETAIRENLNWYGDTARLMPREETREYFLAKKRAYEGLLMRLEEEYKNKL